MRVRHWICSDESTGWIVGWLSCVLVVGALLGGVQSAAAQTQGDTGLFEDFAPTCSGVCRTVGFWGQRGDGEKGGWNYTQSAIDAAIDAGGCPNVCGVDICGTDQPDIVGSLGSALEALCVRNNDPTQLNQTFRQSVAAVLNCSLSGLTTPETCAAGLNKVLVGITWEQCNANCALGGGANEDLLNLCYTQLDCLNNGWKWFDEPGFMGCAVGSCVLDGDYCGEDAGDCSENVCDLGTNTCSIGGEYCDEFTPCLVNECMPTFGCHDRSLCDSPIRDYFGPPFSCDPEEELGPASSPKLCQDLKRNTCTISNDSISMLCGPQGCCEDNPCTGFCP